MMEKCELRKKCWKEKKIGGGNIDKRFGDAKYQKANLI